jgi:hypothetical protein
LSIKGITRPYRFGITIPVSFSIHERGTIDQLENGGRLWRMKFVCPGAQSVNFMLHSFTASSGMFLYTYNSQRTEFDGPWYNKNTRQGKRLGIFPVQGNTAFIEIYLPPGTDKNSDVVFESVVYGFRQRDIIEPQRLQKNNSVLNIDCQRDVNCSEGDNWCRQKYSVGVVQLETGFQECSGSLLNNVLEDFTPYLLTAFHCLDGVYGDGTLTDAEKAQVEDWSFKFGNINEVCGVNNTLPTYEYSGATFKSAWNVTDFALLQLNEQPVSGTPNFPDVYFNGWDKSGSIPDNTTSLHHPNTRAMKITIDNDAPTICGDMRGIPCNPPSIPPAGTEFWRVSPDIGALEDGSSGAPLFDPDGRVIGQVSHGCNPCGVSHYENLGRFSVSWVGGGHDYDGLRHWLDPYNTLTGNVLNGIHLDNLQYGHTYTGTGAQYHNAYDKMRLGSGDDGASGVVWWTVTSGVTLDVKAGREIQIRPCSWIKNGSETHLYIEQPSCSDVIELSDTESRYKICSTYGIAHGHEIEKKSTNDTPLFDELPNGTLAVVPNPTDGMVTIYYSVALAGTARVEIVNLYGQSISTVADGEQSQGNHTVKFNTQELPNGVYFVQFRSPIGVISKPIIVSH